MLIEILVFIGAVAVFVNSLFILMLVLAVGKLIGDLDDVKKHGTCREMRNMLQVHEKINKISREFRKDIDEMKNKINDLYVMDYYGYEDLKHIRILKSEAVKFERVQDAGDENNRKLIVMKYYTSKSNAEKHKDEIKAFQAEVEKLEKINTCAFKSK